MIRSFYSILIPLAALSTALVGCSSEAEFTEDERMALAMEELGSATTEALDDTIIEDGRPVKVRDASREAQKRYGEMMKERAILEGERDEALRENGLSPLPGGRLTEQAYEIVDRRRRLEQRDEAVEQSEDWRARRAAADPERAQQVAEACSDAGYGDDDSKYIAVTDCMRLEWGE